MGDRVGSSRRGFRKDWGVRNPRKSMGTFLKEVIPEVRRLCLLRWGWDLGSGEP